MRDGERKEFIVKKYIVNIVIITLKNDANSILEGKEKHALKKKRNRTASRTPSQS